MSASSLWQSFLIMNLSAAEVGIATIDAFQWLNDQQSHRTFNPNPLRSARPAGNGIDNTHSGHCCKSHVTLSRIQSCDRRKIISAFDKCRKSIALLKARVLGDGLATNLVHAFHLAAATLRRVQREDRQFGLWQPH